MLHRSPVAPVGESSVYVDSIPSRLHTRQPADSLLTLWKVSFWVECVPPLAQLAADTDCDVHGTSRRPSSTNTSVASLCATPRPRAVAAMEESPTSVQPQPTIPSRRPETYSSPIFGSRP